MGWPSAEIVRLRTDHLADQGLAAVTPANPYVFYSSLLYFPVPLDTQVSLPLQPGVLPAETQHLLCDVARFVASSKSTPRCSSDTAISKNNFPSS